MLTENTIDSNIVGILLSSSSANTLSGNTANSNSNYGIYLSSSNSNTLMGNTYNSNSYYGIYLSLSSANTLSGNTANSNSYGIYLSSSSNNNTLTGNTCNSNIYGIYLSSSNSNTLMGNTCNLNNYGIFLSSSSNSNTIYLNNLSNNTLGNAYVYISSGNIWNSPTTIYYDYNGGSFHKNYLGNYYGNFSGSDADGDGIGNTVYNGTGMTDNYPLMDTSACYSLQAWWLSGDSKMYKDDMSKAPGSVTITNGSSNIWIADQATPLDTGCSNNRWTGQIAFTSKPASGNSFKIEIGYSDGANFTAGGPNATINGNGSDSVFTFQTNSEAFNVAGGCRLALKITNNSSTSYNVQTGGGCSYCSSSLGNPEYMPATLYVATNGTAPNDGSTWEKAFTTIQAAIGAASMGDTIIVGSSTGHGTGTYTENVDVNKSITIKSEKGYATTTVAAAIANDHVFEILTTNITIGGVGCGFSIYGSTGANKAGIYLGSGATGCTIQDNRCGWDDGHTNNLGIYLSSSSNNNTLMSNTCNSNSYDGIKLESSSNNTLTGNIVISNGGCGVYLNNSCNTNVLSGNTANSNSGYGILLSSSNNNMLTENTTDSNIIGIYLVSSSANTLTGNTAHSNSNSSSGIVLSNSNSNTLTGNTISNAGYGIFLSSSNSNTLTGNTANSNSYFGVYLEHSINNILNCNTCQSNSYYGIKLSSSSDNTIYLNNLSGNTSINAYVESSSGNIWNSPTTIYYDYNGGSFHKNYLGNYYGDYTGSDADGDGIGNTVYNGTGMMDNYPLMDTSACYSLQAWWLSGDSAMYKDDRSKSLDSVTLNSGSSNIWIADQATLININVPGTGSWTGQIAFTSAPANGETFTVEIGSSTNGSDFTAGGPDATLIGKDTVTVFTFETDSSAFTIAKGNYIALKITNNSGKSYAVQTGSAWSYCSSPYSSYNYLVSVDNSSMTENIPKEYVLHQNYPNPFNPVTKISYEIPVKSQVTLKVYDMLGREVARLYEGEREAGRYEAEFNGMRFSSGVYFYKLEAGSYTAVKKLLLVK